MLFVFIFFGAFRFFFFWRSLSLLHLAACWFCISKFGCCTCQYQPTFRSRIWKMLRTDVGDNFCRWRMLETIYVSDKFECWWPICKVIDINVSGVKNIMFYLLSSRLCKCSQSALALAFNLSTSKWSILSGLRRSARIFFLRSRSVPRPFLRS